MFNNRVKREEAEAHNGELTTVLTIQVNKNKEVAVGWVNDDTQYALNLLMLGIKAIHAAGIEKAMKVAEADKPRIIQP